MILSDSYEVETFSQSSIYGGFGDNSEKKRKLKIYFSIPEMGINDDTGLLLFIAGFDGQSNSNVYKKMRKEFSDEYNLVTIQCDYFGSEFMQMPKNIFVPKIEKEELSKVFTNDEMIKLYRNGQFDFKSFLNIGSNYDIKVKVEANLSEENIDNFNDMGILQAIDNITAVLNVMNVLYDNNYSFNSKKVIIYGHSQGAYLAYLCNAFAPKLFSLIIDNSAWLYPKYLQSGNDRVVSELIGKLTLEIKFDYLAKKLIDDMEVLELSYLYSKFENNCNIISYHGVTDELISCSEKKKFCDAIKKCKYNEITKEHIDNRVFKSSNHGLDADFIELFKYTMNNLNIEFLKENKLDLEKEVTYKTDKHVYIIDYRNVIPNLRIL